MDIPSSSLSVRIWSWKWAFQPCKISIWIWSHLSFVDQINIHRSKNDLFQRDILTAMDVCFIGTRTDIYLTYDDGGRPFPNGNPSWLECSFSGRYPYCEGGWRNIHLRLDVRLSFLFDYIMFQMDIHHGWNRYLQDDILTVMEDLNPSKYFTV